MRTPKETVAVVPGSFVVHPPGELHEYENGPARTLLFRVRYGDDMARRHIDWRGNPRLAPISRRLTPTSRRIRRGDSTVCSRY